MVGGFECVRALESRDHIVAIVLYASVLVCQCLQLSLPSLATLW